MEVKLQRSADRNKTAPVGILKNKINLSRRSDSTTKNDHTELNKAMTKSINNKSVIRTPGKSQEKKLRIQIPDTRLNTLQDQPNSATIPQKSKLKLTNLKQMKRMSTIAINDINKSIAHTFDFKDLKNLQNEASTVADTIESTLYGTSLCIFSKDNWIRKIDNKIVTHSYFDYFILLIIVISSITLALENPLNDPNSRLSQNLEIINM